MHAACVLQVSHWLKTTGGSSRTSDEHLAACCFETCAGSDGARLHVEGVRARVMTTAAAAAKAKFGTTEAEFNAVAELLGTDADDEDFCPTCLEAYTDGKRAHKL